MSRKPIYQHEGRLQPQSVERTSHITLYKFVLSDWMVFDLFIYLFIKLAFYNHSIPVTSKFKFLSVILDSKFSLFCPALNFKLKTWNKFTQNTAELKISLFVQLSFSHSF